MCRSPHETTIALIRRRNADAVDVDNIVGDGADRYTAGDQTRGRIQHYRKRFAGDVTVRRDDIELAVAIAIGKRNGEWPYSHGSGLQRGDAGAGGTRRVVLRNTDTRLPLSSAAIRSGLPSPLTSAAAAAIGSGPAAKDCLMPRLAIMLPAPCC